MNIEGNQVVLRILEEQDREMLQNLIEDPDVTRVTGGYSSIPSYDHLRIRFCSPSNASKDLYRIIADRQNPRTALGIIILSPTDLEKGTADIYIKLLKSARQKGYGQDAVNALVSYAFKELGFERIDSHILEHNTASRRLFEKCGFTREEVRQSRVYPDGHSRIVYVYERSREQEDTIIF